MPSEIFVGALEQLSLDHDVEAFDIDAGRPYVQPDASGLREFEGSPEELIERIAGVDVLVVHGAPVSRGVVCASDSLQLVGCARGGAVNIDAAALAERGIPLVTTPGKNAVAVAELTMSFLIALARRLREGEAFMGNGGRLGSTFDGAQFIGAELGGRVLGLVGYGHVGRNVATRAAAFGLRVLVYDPKIAVADPLIVQVETLEELLEESDFVSLHARATVENENLFSAETFARMRPGAYFVNTARESLVDESALDDALASGHLAGAALDVIRDRPYAGRHPLLRHPNMILTPHIGGATHETLVRGAQILVGEILNFNARDSIAPTLDGAGT